MKLFRKNKIQWQGSTHERDQEVAPVAHDTTIHLSAKFEGVITSKSNIFIYGEVIGDIFAEQGHLVVHRTAKVVGNLYARSILIEGRVEGVCVAPYLKISSSAHVNGRVKAYRLLIDEGARFVGFSEYVVSDKKLAENPFETSVSENGSRLPYTGRTTYYRLAIYSAVFFCCCVIWFFYGKNNQLRVTDGSPGQATKRSVVSPKILTPEMTIKNNDLVLLAELFEWQQDVLNISVNAVTKTRDKTLKKLQTDIIKSTAVDLRETSELIRRFDSEYKIKPYVYLANALTDAVSDEHYINLILQCYKKMDELFVKSNGVKLQDETKKLLYAVDERLTENEHLLLKMAAKK